MAGRRGSEVEHAATADIETLARITVMLRSAGTCRAAVAEDYDEYGALWVVLSSYEGRSATFIDGTCSTPTRGAGCRSAQRSGASTASTRGPRTSPASPAAASAAELFDVPPGPMVEAERSSGEAYQGIGTAGGPFPWWKALWLPWPEEAIGRPLGPGA